MAKTIKSINHMSIHHPYACLQETSYITIRHVQNQKEARLSRSEGNVNLTDFWFSIVDSLANNNKACSCQNIGLLADVPENEDTDWWIKQDGNRICIGFLKIASKSGLSVKDAMKMLEKIIAGNGKLFRTLDNADIILVLTMKQEMKEQMDSLINEIISCENNGVSIYFSRFFVYGRGEAEDNSLIIKELEIAKEPVKYCNKHVHRALLCNNLANEMIKRINEYKRQKNKKMMSYYQALLQILNILGQYEQEKPYKDLFFIFYPPITLFIAQLKESQEEVEQIEEKILLETRYSEKQKMTQEKQVLHKEIEKSISLFLETMELLMHHIGQSCEEIIGKTGHGGMPYDIPLRIILMYVSFLNILSDVLVEDTGPKKEFEYCLSPLAFTQSATTGFNIGNMEKSRLIRVKMPRHMLFMPRPFLVILAHEASHYAHESSRMRPERAKCMRKITENVMVEILFGNNITEETELCSEKELPVLQAYLHTLSHNLQIYLENEIYKMTEQEGGMNQETERKQDAETNQKAEWSPEGKKNPQKYYLDNFTALLQETAYKIFYDENRNLSEYVYKIDDATMDAIRDIKHYPNMYEKITRIQQHIIDNAESAAYNGTLNLFLHNLKKTFREIYADLSAIRVLELSWDDYLEAYILSESCEEDLECFQPELLNRFAMVKYILGKKETTGWKDECCGTCEPAKCVNGWHNIQEMKKPIQAYKKIIEESVQKYTPDKTSNKKGKESISQTTKRILGTEYDWFYCEPILAWEAEFFKDCDDSLEKYIKKQESDAGEKLKKLRKFYKSFDVRPHNEDGSFAEFFDAFDDLTSTYKKSVQKNIEEPVQD